MTDPALSIGFDPAEADRAALVRALRLADALAEMLHAGREQLVQNQPPNLAGLDSGAGQLCARVLDLPAALRPQLRPRLESLVDEIDALGRALLRHAMPG